MIIGNLPHRTGYLSPLRRQSPAAPCPDRPAPLP